MWFDFRALVWLALAGLAFGVVGCVVGVVVAIVK